MLRMCAAVAVFSCLLAVSSYAQAPTPSASPNDWEEINFEFSSAVLSDGFPSLLRLADLLKAHSGYRVRVEGNTDNLGSQRSNERLGLARANAVKDFLVKYGAASSQITVATRGKSDQKYPGYKSTYSKTDVARWMNRRVVLMVTDEQGRTVSDGGAREAIQAIQPPPQPAQAPLQDCCQDILRRLDKLDDIAKMLQQLVDQNAALRKEVDNLKNQQTALENRVGGIPKPLTEQQTSEVVEKQLEAARQPRFSLLGVNAGSDDRGNITFSGKGRYFAPFKEHFAFQAQGEYLYYKTQREGQLDFGLVDRIGNFQGGLFASLKHVNLSGAANGGNLGQGALTIDYLFKYGRLGVFGTKGFLNNAVLDRRNATFATGLTNADGTPIIGTAPNIFLERYLSIIDQAGVSTTVGLWGNNYLEANIGYLRSVGNADRPGGTVRFIFPIRERFAFTAEGGVNETLLGAGNNGRAVFGFQWGNFMRPKDYRGSDHPAPADIPRIRYELLTRRIHVGVSPPIADAGPDQIGVPAGTITLNGSNSRDPNGEQLTFQWTPETSTAVALSAPTSAITTFNAVAGASYSFRLTVRNTDNQSASARVRVTTMALKKVQIQFFIADPTTINGGQQTKLSWKIVNADSAEISPNVGSVNAQAGEFPVLPSDTTTYTLTAKNANSSDISKVVVTVQRPKPSLAVCTAVPMTINQGETAKLVYNALNADSVTITPGAFGTLPPSGEVTVTPASSTSYTITATNAFDTAMCNVEVQVTPGSAPRIIRFSAGPASIQAGGTSTLVWQVENATTVTITPDVGTVGLVGTQDVKPSQTTIYTLTATNNFGTVPAKAEVMVTAPPPPVNPTITSFTANPPASPSPGSPVVLTCLTQNANKVTISGVGDVDANGNITVNPQTSTTYTCVATGSSGAQASQSLNLPVTPGGGGSLPVIIITSSAANCVPAAVVGGTTTCQTVVRLLDLDLSGTTSPTGNNPLTFLTTSRHTAAAVLNPTSTRPSVQLGEGFGDYFFDIIVTDSKGNQALATIDVQYVKTR